MNSVHSSLLEVNCTEMGKLSGYLTREVFEINCSDFQHLDWGYAYDTDQTQLCNPGTKLIRVHTHDADIVPSVWRVKRCWAPRSACPRILWGNSYCRPGSLKRGWLQTGVVVSGDAFSCTYVCPRVENHSISIINEG